MFLCNGYFSKFICFDLVESADFKKGVTALAQVLNITPHPDHLITLKAVSKVVREKLNQDALDNQSNIIVKVRFCFTFYFLWHLIHFHLKNVWLSISG